MKGLYLTEEGKQEIEDLIAKLTDYKNKTHDIYAVGQIYILKQILSSATILSVEESWKHIGHDSGVFWGTDADILLSMYPNGVIIQPKQSL
jgi:hypothetical protein